MVKVGLLGFGTIGVSLAKAIQEGKAGDTELVAVMVRDRNRVDQTQLPPGVSVATTISEFLGQNFDVVVEAAGHEALREYAEAVLESQKDLMLISVGALADEEFFSRIRDLAKKTGHRILIPSGAIAALETISAASLAEIEEVFHTVRKHPRAFTPTQLRGANPQEPSILYDGPALAGVQMFPENVNVAAAVALAGIGFTRTRLRVVADPDVVLNTHEIQVRGYFGQLNLVMQNIPTDNPKTGRIVALSIARALARLSAPVLVGA